MSKAFEEALKAIANAGNIEPPFKIGQPVWLHGDSETCWIVQNTCKSAWGKHCVIAQPEGLWDVEPTLFPCEWLTDRLPGEPDYTFETKPFYTGNVVDFEDYRRR